MLHTTYVSLGSAIETVTRILGRDAAINMLRQRINALTRDLNASRQVLIQPCDEVDTLILKCDIDALMDHIVDLISLLSELEGANG